MAADWLAAQVGAAPFGAAGESRHILLIDRGEPDPFYLSTKNRKRPGAGRTRRSIPNIRELHDQLLKSGYPTRLEQLEGKSLASQIDLFRWADIIIAQHGAALANIIWAKPTATVIEVLPEGLADRIHFRELAAVMGCPYISVSQDGEHAPVDAAAIVKQVAALTA